MTFQPLQIDVHAVRQIDPDRVPNSLIRRRHSTMLYRRDLVQAFDYPFRKKKTNGERLVIARSPHRDRDRLVNSAALTTKADANLQRLFHSESVFQLFYRAIHRDALNRNFRDRWRSLHKEILSQ